MRLIVTTMKDEGPFFLEWIAYHQSIGFDHFIINTNDCSDGTDKIAVRLQELGIATHIDNPAPWRKGPQQSAYDNAMAHPKLADAEWIFVSDADEFLNIKAGDGTLDALFAAVPEANMYSFTWQLFGHGGIVDFEDKFVTEQFTQAADPYQQWPATCRAIKTLYRNDGLYSLLSTHRPKKLAKGAANKLKWVDGDGDDMGKSFAHFGWHSAHHGVGFGDKLARMHHYATRSLNSYLMKRVRGDVRTTANHKKLEETGVNYWQLHCWNSVENTSILKNAARTRSAFETLMDDKLLNSLHKASVAHHKKKIGKIKKTPAAQHFMNQFKSHVSSFEWTQGHDAISCPNLALDPSKFDATTYSDSLRVARQRDTDHARKFGVLPWFAILDTTGVNFAGKDKNAPAADDPVRNHRPENPVYSTQPKRKKMRQQLLRSLRVKVPVWAVINSGDPEIIEQILSLKNPNKLFVFNAWGFRTSHPMLGLKQGAVKERFVAQEYAYLDFVKQFRKEIGSGVMSVRRADPYYGLKLLPQRHLGGAFVSGSLPIDASRILLRQTLLRIAEGGLLISDSYHRRGKHGDANLRALHMVIREQSSSVRVDSIEGAHCTLRVLPAHSEHATKTHGSTISC